MCNQEGGIIGICEGYIKRIISQEQRSLNEKCRYNICAKNTKEQPNTTINHIRAETATKFEVICYIGHVFSLCAFYLLDMMSIEVHS